MSSPLRPHRADAKQRRVALKALIDGGEALAVPGAFDAMSAMLIANAGFPALYIGSAATAASRLGLPDVGLMTMTEMVAQAKAVVDAVSVPVIADAENGWGHAVNIWRTVQAFEDAGVSAIHIEDHEFGKHTSVSATLTTMAVATERIRAAVDARRDPDFLIIARTDVPWATGDAAETVRRLNAFANAGADLVMPAGMTAAALARMRGQISGRVVLVDCPGESLADQRRAGASLVLYWGLATLAAFDGISAALERFRDAGDVDPLAALRDQTDRFMASTDDPGFEERARRYRLI